MQQPTLDGLINPKPVYGYHGRYDPAKPTPYKISRSKIELFLNCPYCFYLDRRLGIERPSMPPFRLNSAVDTLLKKEFDIHRAKHEPHPLMKTYEVDAIPYSHPSLDKWRENFIGIQHLHSATNLLITGAIDDVWQSPNGELIVVDYKATAKDQAPTIEGFWQQAYKRQLEVYQWLMRQLGFPVSDTGYFVYANGKYDRAAFDGKLEFDIEVIPYTGKDDWVEPTIVELHKCLNLPTPPAPAPNCEYCQYAAKVKKYMV
ncbi:PD-(D/E)XK nuclease family protein [Candidatus Microgenomates bacterium]|nr:PD-(D/E)XK nuclease family protein [Candidatus Microgenomates bacterium]